MSTKTKHACTLEPGYHLPSPRPLSGAWQRLRYGMPCFLACGWHHAARLYLSEKGLQMEQEKQIAKHLNVIHPYSPFSHYWDWFLMIVYWFSLLYLPVQAFHPCPDPYNYIILFTDAVGFLKILICFYMGFVENDGKNVIMEKSAIAKNYIKTTFFIDVISSIPFQLMIPDKDCRYPVHTIMYILKILRVVACRQIWQSLSEQYLLSYTWSLMLLLFAKVIMFYHWMTFIHYQMPMFVMNVAAPDRRLTHWLVRVRAGGARGAGRGAVGGAGLEAYVTNLHMVAEQCSGVGPNGLVDMNNQLPVELLFIALLSLSGMFFVVYVLTTLLRIVLYQNYESLQYHGHLKELHEYLKYKNIPQRLRQKIQLYINYRFNGHFFNTNSILNTLNVQIKQEINMHFCKKLVANVPLFQDMPIALVNTIIFSLTKVLYMPGEVLVRYGSPSSSLYLIGSGTVAIMDAQGNEVGHMKDGAYFGEQALLRPGTQRTATVVALEITEIYKVNNNQFRAALQPWPRLRRRLLYAGEEGPRPQ